MIELNFYRIKNRTKCKEKCRINQKTDHRSSGKVWLRNGAVF